MSGRTRVKICGITSRPMADMAVRAGADAIGLVIDVPDSPRTIPLDLAAEIAASVPRIILAVAVVRNPDATFAERWTGGWIQLHGDEDEDLVAAIARTKHVIKGFRFDPDALMRWNDCPQVDVLLVDGSAGGKAQAFDHGSLARLMPRITKPVIIAGGLRADNVHEAIRALHPFAVDVSSGVESAPGVKDPDMVRAFCEAVAAAE